MAVNKKLSQAEAERLIEMVKSTLIAHIEAPDIGKSTEFEVKGNSESIIFTINIFRGKRNRDKTNFGARVKISNQMLLELHLGATNRHLNPDGTVITGSHWHMYSEGYGTKNAFPADDIRDKDFVKNTVSFLQKFNVVDMPQITEQMLLDMP